MAAALAIAFRLHAHFDVWHANRDFFERAGRREGLYVIAPSSDLEAVQLRTRRAPLFDIGLLDTIPYVPSMAVGVESILNEVYGVTLLDTSNWAQFDGLRARWEARPADEWRRVLQARGVTDIIVPSSWELKLPRVDASDDLALFTIAP